MAPKSRIRVLFIEERPSESSRLPTLLAEPEASILDVSMVSWAPEALKRVAGKRFDVALLNFAVLDARAIAMVKKLHDRIALLPIVVVSDHDADGLTIEVMRAGADDHLKHGDLSAKVLARSLTFAVARNVGMRKKAAAPASREVQMTAGVILDRLPMGVVLVNATGKVLLMNRKAREIAAQNDGFLVEAPTRAPNGRVLMFFRQEPSDTKGGGGRSRLYSIDLTGYNEREIVTPLDASDPAWSPLIP